MILMSFKFLNNKLDEYMGWRPWLKYDSLLMWFLLKTLHLSLGMVLILIFSFLVTAALMLPLYMALSYSFLWLGAYLLYVIDVGFACTYTEWKKTKREETE